MNNQKEIDQFVTDFLTTHGIVKYRDLFQHHCEYSKESMPTSCESLIRPFSLTPEEYNLESGLLAIALSNPKTEIRPLYREKLVETLILKNPKKVGDFTPPVADLSEKVKQKPSKKGGIISKSKKESTLISSTASGEVVKKRKRVRLESRQDLDEDREEATYYSQDEKKSKHSTTQSTTSKSVTNLQPIMKKVFDEFWDEHLDPSIAAPFFSLITRENCSAFGIADYFSKVEDACTLITIKDRLSSGVYQFAENFTYDFNLMFNNVFLYYDSTSPQYQKALELKEKFSQRWETACALYK